MSKRKRFILMGVVGVVCALAAVALRGCILWYVNPKPWKVGSVSIPERQMTVSLFFGSMDCSPIEPYDGTFRIVEISQHAKPTMYYDIPSLIARDGCRLEVYWYPTNNLIRLKDTALVEPGQEKRSECLLDLDQNIMFAVLRGNGITHIARLSIPMRELSIPQCDDWSMACDYQGSLSNLGRNPLVMIGGRESKFVDAPWTLSPGMLIGVIAPNRVDPPLRNQLQFGLRN